MFFLDPTDFDCMDNNSFQNILFCILQKKESHTGLERHEVVQIMT